MKWASGTILTVLLSAPASIAQTYTTYTEDYERDTGGFGLDPMFPFSGTDVLAPLQCPSQAPLGPCPSPPYALSFGDPVEVTFVLPPGALVEKVGVWLNAAYASQPATFEAVGHAGSFYHSAPVGSSWTWTDTSGAAVGAITHVNLGGGLSAYFDSLTIEVVVPPPGAPLLSLVVEPPSILAGMSATGHLCLSWMEASPSVYSVSVGLSSSVPNVSVASTASVQILPPGVTPPLDPGWAGCLDFVVSTTSVGTPVSAEITAIYGGRTAVAMLHVAPDPDCNGNDVWDAWDVDPGDPDGNGYVSPDCQGNQIPDECDLDSADPDGNGQVSPDCNLNSVPDECEVPPIAPASDDCNSNGVPDDCDIALSDPDGDGHISPDCNSNATPDECDVHSGDPDGNGQVSYDCQPNIVPDECEIPPLCSEGIPECSADCQQNAIPDECEVPPICASGAPACSLDCQSNLRPDECEVPPMCGGGPPHCSLDCQPNTVPDECEIPPICALGPPACSMDCQLNEVPDECDILAPFAVVSEQLSPLSTGSVQLFTIADAPPAMTDAELTFVAYADLNATFEYVDVDINDVPIGSVFVANGADCPLTCTDELTVPANDYNAAVAGGEARIRMVPSSGVSAESCEQPSHISVHVSYQESKDDCNATDVPDECEIISGVDFDSDGDVDLDDFSAFRRCMAGPGILPDSAWPDCVDPCLAAFDDQGDNDVDLQDFSIVQGLIGS